MNMPDAKILIVEDEGIEALDLQHRLTSLGYTAPDIVATGEEAVIKAGETHPDLILMDIMLRGEMDGVTAASRIHASFDIPIIFLTAYADEDTLRRAKITEPHGYLVKPCKEKDLHISIDMALYKHKMERKLKESEKWFATTLGSIGDAVIATDKNGLITFMNPVAEGLTGWKTEDAFFKKIAEVFNRVNMDTHKPVEDPVARVLLEGVTAGLANHTLLIVRDGKEIPIDDSAAPIKDDKGNIIGVVLIFRDVTEHKRMEAELRRHAAELEAANEELAAFVHSVSHDLRAPLRTISGFINILHEKYSERLDAEGKDFLTRVYNGSNKMRRLIDDLLFLSRISRQEINRIEFDVSRMASSLIANLREESPGRKVEISIQEGLTAFADVGLADIVLTNLLDNAWKFTSKTENARIEVDAFKQDGKTVYYVRDNGAGFNPAYKDKLFCPFQRLHSDKEFEGTGIGLTTVERIIRRHGGKVWCEGEVGKGATVYFTLG
jgi:two-component system cell cycle sensor histidine kinase/response regulator CckA